MDLQNAVFEGLDDLGETHESYAKLSQKNELKMRRASSALSIPKNKLNESTPSKRIKLTRKEETRRMVEQEVLQQQKERGSLSKFQGSDDPQELLDSPEFERGLNLYFDDIDRNNKDR
jgi:hypothetical protein